MIKQKPEIAVLYPFEDDPQSVILTEELMNKGAKVYYIPFKISDSKNKLISYSNLNKIQEDISNCSSIFVRNIAVETPYMAPPFLGEGEFYAWKSKYIKENQKIFSINSILNNLQRKGCLIINPLNKFLYHNTKGFFFSKLRKLGISTPRLINTNSLNEIEKFLDIHPKAIIKSGSGIGGTRVLNKITELNQQELERTPIFLQEKIDGYTARIHTVGNKVVLALKVHSDDIDSRTATKGFDVIELSESQKSQVIKANKYFGINFSAWDAIIDKNNEIFLIDCNPGPYIWWIGPYFTRYVMSHLAKFMITYSQTKDIDEANNSLDVDTILIDKMKTAKSENSHHIQKLQKEWRKLHRQRY